ncbi:hypothetical protein [Paenibacillus sp. MMS20-IR301]|uniref:hypothetical protein n=1 Tax=Paenibacillus sp. MMS20-IR301 TaxID=2895946 RepID=UPI0028EF7AC7|nr:hypothetical protein [Paenibacillus sp. MMS20-IR301]WNS41420.1 hypothetical protein LOS79_20555 [Paenibacillus sp. MMS20-IR301]
MLLYVTVKSLGKRKPVLERQELVLEQLPATLQELIEQIVILQIEGLVHKQERGDILPFLTGTEIKEQAGNGKVGFGAVYNHEVPDPAKAVAAALLAYEDGLYKVFLQEQECASLKEPLEIHEGDELVFIRFTMLAGRLW